MNTKSLTTDIQELFSADAITALSSIQVTQAIQQIKDMYDNAFMLGGEDLQHIPSPWTRDDRTIIYNMVKCLLYIIELSGKYDFVADYNIETAEAEKLYEIFEDEGTFNNNKCLQLLEDITMLYTYFRIVEDGVIENMEYTTDAYKLYRHLKTIITGFHHPGEYFMSFKVAS